MSSCLPATVKNDHIFQAAILTNGSFTVPVVASPFVFGDNGVNAEAWLPHIACFPSCTANTPLIRVSYDVPSISNYDWNSGPSPGLGSQGKNGVWQQFASQLENPVFSGGIDSYVQSRDSRDLFLAGALVGLGGALLAAAMQCFVTLWFRRSFKAPLIGYV